MTEYEAEPIRGLPGLLPPGELILWQGSPAPLLLARSAFHVRAVAIYFALLTAMAIGMVLVRGMRLRTPAVSRRWRNASKEGWPIPIRACEIPRDKPSGRSRESGASAAVPF